MPFFPNNTVETCEKILSLQIQSVNHSDYLASLLPILGCTSIRLFEKGTGTAWVELSRVIKKADSVKTLTYNSDDCISQPMPFPQELYCYMDSPAQAEARYASFTITDRCKMQSGLEDIDIPVDIEYFHKAEIQSNFILPVQHRDGAKWLLCLEDNDLMYFKHKKELTYPIFAISIGTQLWRLKEFIDAKLREIKDDNLLHEERNAAGIMQGELLTIRTNLTQLPPSDQVTHIIEGVNDLLKQIETKEEQFQEVLDKMSPELRESPDSFKKNAYDFTKKPTMFSVKKVLNDSVTAKRLKAEEKKSMSIKLDISSELELVMCLGYVDKLLSILANLIGNSIEHGPLKDTIYVKAKQKQGSTPDKLALRISIINTINSNESQAAAGKTVHRTLSGSKLGIPAVQLARSFFKDSAFTHKEVDGKYKATLDLLLDLVPPNTQQPTATAAKRILVIDDNKTTIKIIENSLKQASADYKVDPAYTVAEAWNLLKAAKSHYDVILVDGTLDNKASGVDLAVAIKKQNIPSALVWISGNELKPNDAKIFDAQFVKPINIKGLVSYIQKKQNRDETHSQFKP